MYFWPTYWQLSKKKHVPQVRLCPILDMLKSKCFNAKYRNKLLVWHFVCVLQAPLNEYMLLMHRIKRETMINGSTSISLLKIIKDLKSALKITSKTCAARPI